MNKEIEALTEINMRLSLLLGMAYGMLASLEAYTDKDSMDELEKKINNLMYSKN